MGSCHEPTAAVTRRGGRGFFGLSSRDAALVAVSIRPIENAPRRVVVTPLRLAAPSPPTAVERTPLPAAGDDAATLAFRAPETPVAKCAPAPQTASQASARPVVAATSRTVEPLDAERVRLHMTVSRRFLAKLEETKDALSHARPGASAEEVLEACMDVLLAQRARRRAAVIIP